MKTRIDPSTRRHMWDIIIESKDGRAILLTTHSMEEADALCSRIGIMVKGQLKCLGASQVSFFNFTFYFLLFTLLFYFFTFLLFILFAKKQYEE